MAGADVVVRFIGDATSAVNAAKQVESSQSRLASTLVKTGAALTAGVTLPLVALGAAAFKELTQAGKVAAQTTAVIKSTGQAAGVTAKEVDGLANSMLRKTGIDDEAIKSGENMLLTFTNIKNVAGKNNDIFTQATKITADLSVAFGKDMTDSAVLVGKALQDPIAGLTALSRVGVQFTQTQKDQIRHFMELGDVMSAQKIILGELTTQVGGSANAYGKTMAGQLAIAKNEMLNAAAAVIMTLAPSLRVLADVATAVAGALQSLPPGMRTAVGVMGLLAAATGPAITAIGGLIKAFEALPTIVGALKTAGQAVQTFTALSGLMAPALAVAGLGLLLVAAKMLSVATATEKATEAGKKHGEQLVESITAGTSAGVAYQQLATDHGILTAKVNETQEAYDHYNAIAKNATGATNEQGISALEASLRAHDLGVELAHQTAKNEVLAEATKKAHRELVIAEATERARVQSLSAMNAGVQQSTDEILANISAMQQYGNAMLAAQGGMPGYEAALLNQEAAYNRLQKSIADTGADSLETRTAANQLETATLAVSAAALKTDADITGFNATLTQESVPALEAQKAAIIRTALAHDGNTLAVQGEIEKIDALIYIANQTPPQKVTDFYANTGPAMTAIDQLNARADFAARTRDIQFNVNASVSGAAQAVLNFDSGPPGPGTKGLPSFGAGGIVPGPKGSPLLAVVHGGETVIPAGGGTATYNININVAAGGNPAQVGAATVDAIRAYERANGKSWRAS